MSLLRSDDFIAGVERQVEWYALHATWEVATHYLATVEAASRLLEAYPLLGPNAGFTHPRLKEWRFFALLRPFAKHLLFYEITGGGDVILRRTMHGSRHLPTRLLQPPA